MEFHILLKLDWSSNYMASYYPFHQVIKGSSNALETENWLTEATKYKEILTSYLINMVEFKVFQQ